jgi:hypothetical protein
VNAARIQLALAWIMLVGSVAGLIASLAGVVGQDEPRLVLALSWIALIYAAFTAIFAAGVRRKQEDDG